MPASKRERLAWRLRLEGAGCQLTPCVQQHEAGLWSRGRALPLLKLLSEGRDGLEPQDLRLMRALAGQLAAADGDVAALDALPLLPLLIGHPAVFDAEAPDAPLRLEAGQVALEIERNGDSIALRLSPPGIAGCGGVLWQRLSPSPRAGEGLGRGGAPARSIPAQAGYITVYQLDENLKQIAALLGHSLTLPWQARMPALDAIRDLAPGLPVHDVSPTFDASRPSQSADAALHALLQRSSDGLIVKLKVKPHAHSAWYAPGGGPAQLLLTVDGARLQLVRDLPAERQSLKALRAACPSLAQARRERDEWHIEGQPAALQLLSELQAQPALRCVWPHGEKLRLAHAGAPQLKLQAKRKGGWLEMSGELELDDGRILALRHLLQALQAGHGRYVSISDGDWLALNDALAQQLSQLARLVDHAAGDALRVSPLAAAQLAALAEDAGEFEIDAAFRQQLERLRQAQACTTDVPAALQATLRPYQRQGFQWMARLAEWGLGACLADDMGLGKTVQTLSLLLTRAHLGPQLVVAPTSVALNWLAEAARFAPSLRLRAYQQHRRLDDAGPGDLIVVSYGLLQREAEAFGEVHWATAVLDEAQAIKNPTSQRAQAAQGLRADFRLAASGTPVENHLMELWSLFRFAAPGLLGTQAQFEQRYARAIMDGDEAARAALKALIQPYLLRRTKREVLTELPPRSDINRLVELSDEERHVYEAMRQQALDKVAQAAADPAAAGGSMQALAELTRLRRFCCHPKLTQPDSALSGSKLAACLDIIDELLDNGHKALIFSQFVDHLALVRAELEARGIAYHYLDGSTPTRQRKASMDAFQAGERDLFLISLKAGGTGLNLTAADYVLHLDPWWNPAVEDQASDRAHRMGQQRPVTVYRLIAAATVEEKIVALHAEKRALADSLLAGGDISAGLDAAALLALLREG